MPISIENLPYPIVQYPCGAFVAFKQNEDEDYFFCSCMYEAIENHIRIRLYEREIEIKLNKKRYESYRKLNRESAFILNPWDFGGNIVKKLMAQKVKEDVNIINKINFDDKLCHECNQATPAAVFCHPMYGGKFKQKYGWYINKKRYEFGLNIDHQVYLPERCPFEIKKLVSFRYIDLYADIKEYYPADFEGLPHWQELLHWCDSKYDECKTQKSRKIFMHNNESPQKLLPLEFFSTYFCKECNKVSVNQNGYLEVCKPNLGNQFNPSSLYGMACFAYNVIIDKVISKRYRKINSVIENEVRQAFGVKKIGEAWTSESILYTIVNRVFSSHNVIRHYRPGILEGLELDIYIKELNIGIEYQGIQHFKPVKHWGGKEGLKRTKERDKRKAELCALNGIRLIYFDHTENLSEELISRKIKNILNDGP